jgi:TetR/AcrR family transcriptional regulator, transcriptional repressor for nem operon
MIGQHKSPRHKGQPSAVDSAKENLWSSYQGEVRPWPTSKSVRSVTVAGAGAHRGKPDVGADFSLDNNTNQLVFLVPTSWYEMTAIDLRHDSKKRFLDAALHVIRAKGYAAARIEDICEVAGLTKGSFFHHFKGKEDLALEAAKYWGDTISALFSSAVYRTLADPVDRLLAYVDFRKAVLQGDLPDFTCLAGTMVQEVYDTHPEIREACNKCISDHAATLQPDIEDAMRQRNIRSSWTAESLALYTQAAIQGAIVLAKAKHNAAVATACMDHLRRYLELLFTEPKSQKEIV